MIWIHLNSKLQTILWKWYKMNDFLNFFKILNWIDNEFIIDYKVFGELDCFTAVQS